MFEINPDKKKEQTEIGKKGVETAFVTAVRLSGGKAYKFTSEMNRGVSDRIVIYPGQVWFVEIKRSSGKLTPLQVKFKAKIEGLGLNHFTVYGSEDIPKFLDAVHYIRILWRAGDARNKK